MRVTRIPEGHLITLPFPLDDDRDLQIHASGDALLIEVGGFRRALTLPRALRDGRVTDACLERGSLRIRIARVERRR